MLELGSLNNNEKIFWKAFGKHYDSSQNVDMKKINVKLAKKTFPKREAKTVKIEL